MGGSGGKYAFGCIFRLLLGLQLHGTCPYSCILQEEFRRKWEKGMARGMEMEVAAAPKCFKEKSQFKAFWICISPIAF
jgi:hypothetical protein